MSSALDACGVDSIGVTRPSCALVSPQSLPQLPVLGFEGEPRRPLLGQVEHAASGARIRRWPFSCTRLIVSGRRRYPSSVSRRCGPAISSWIFPEIDPIHPHVLLSNLVGRRQSTLAGAPPAATVRRRKDRNRTAIRLLNAWLHEDVEVESDTWDLLKSELGRDRFSRRRLWNQPSYRPRRTRVS